LIGPFGHAIRRGPSIGTIRPIPPLFPFVKGSMGMGYFGGFPARRMGSMGAALGFAAMPAICGFIPALGTTAVSSRTWAHERITPGLKSECPSVKS
jgi:hypothetical protein